MGLCTVVPAVHLAHPLPQVRTAARYLLATRPDKLALREVRPRVTDADPYTRVAAVFALERYTQLWDQATTLLASVFFNPSPDAPHSALYLAARIKHRGLIAPLISRLDEDAALGRIDSSSG